MEEEEFQIPSNVLENGFVKTIQFYVGKSLTSPLPQSSNPAIQTVIFVAEEE